MNSSNDCTATTLTDDVLSTIFSFIDLPDVSAVSRTSKQFKASLDAVEDELFHSLVEFHCKRQYPWLVKYKELLPPGNQSWKIVMRLTLVSSYEPAGYNQKLQKAFEEAFRNEGILAFSNCCHFACSSAYNERDPFFIVREKGIYFVRLHLNGMNYSHDETFLVAANYADYDYLIENWDSECKILERWCQVLGLGAGDFTIEKPPSLAHCVLISFKAPLELDMPQWAYDDDDDDDGSTSTSTEYHQVRGILDINQALDEYFAAEDNWALQEYFSSKDDDDNNDGKLAAKDKMG